MAVRVWGEDTPFEPESLEEEEEEEKEEEGVGGITLPPHSPLHETLLSLGDIFHRQAGVTVDACQPKLNRTKTGPSTGSPP
jgi:hypothetical protein